MSDEDLEKIVKEVDLRGNGVINYHDFISATFNPDQYATKERLESLFQKFDTHGTHGLTDMTLREAFTKVGHHLTHQEIEEIMNEHDVDHHHQITFNEFKNMVLDHM